MTALRQRTTPRGSAGSNTSNDSGERRWSVIRMNKEQNQMPMPERRLGRFNVSREVLRSRWPEIAETLMKGLVVVAAENDFATDTMRYIAFGPHFEEVPHGSLPPFYIATIQRDPMLELRVVWTKADETTAALYGQSEFTESEPQDTESPCGN